MVVKKRLPEFIIPFTLSGPVAFTSPAAAEDLLLRPPEGARSADVGKAVRAMRERLEAADTPGVSVESVEHDGSPMVRVSVPGPLTNEVRTKVEYFARNPGSEVEIRVRYALSNEEREKYGPGPRNKPEEDRPPRDGEWFRRAQDFGDQYALCLRRRPFAKRSDISSLKYDGHFAYYEISSSITRELKALLSKASTPDESLAYLVLDGKVQCMTPTEQAIAVTAGNSPAVLVGCFNLARDERVGEDKEYRRARIYVPMDYERTVDLVLKYPMPFALEATE